MRTNITIDSKLIQEAQAVAGVATKAKAVAIALQEFVRWHRIAQVKRQRGKLRFRADTARIRRHD